MLLTCEGRGIGDPLWGPVVTEGFRGWSQLIAENGRGGRLLGRDGKGIIYRLNGRLVGQISPALDALIGRHLSSRRTPLFNLRAFRCAAELDRGTSPLSAGGSAFTDGAPIDGRASGLGIIYHFLEDRAVNLRAPLVIALVDAKSAHV